MRLFLVFILLFSVVAARADDQVFPVWGAVGPHVVVSGLTVSNSTSNSESALADTPLSSGKVYYEVKVVAAGGHRLIGIAPPTASLNAYIDSGWSWYVAENATPANGYLYHGFNIYLGNSGLATYAAGDVVGVAVDLDAGKLWFSKNGSWISGDPAAGTSPSFSGFSGAFVPAVSMYGLSTVSLTANFGASPMLQNVPAGFAPGWFIPAAVPNNILALGLTGAIAPMVLAFALLSVLLTGGAGAWAFAKGLGR